jgi:tRNA(Arg) A34 adenosine deaminase TadA
MRRQGGATADHHYFLEQAVLEATEAREEGQNPIGCVIADHEGHIIARAHNQVSKLKDPTAHAEMLAIRAAIPLIRADSARGWTLYSTLEPCPMCMGTIIMCHIGTVVWAAPDRRIRTRGLLSANAYMRTRRLTTIACPYPDLEQTCSEMHDAYWISRGRPDAVRPAT